MTFDRSAPPKRVPDRAVRERWAPFKLAPVKFALTSSDPFKFARCKSACDRFTPLKLLPRRLHPARSTPVWGRAWQLTVVAPATKGLVTTTMSTPATETSNAHAMENRDNDRTCIRNSFHVIVGLYASDVALSTIQDLFKQWRLPSRSAIEVTGCLCERP